MRGEWFSGKVRCPYPGAGAHGGCHYGARRDGGGDGEHECVLDAGVEGDRPICGAEAGKPVLHPSASGQEERLKDAEWIATCLLKGLVRGSYVPEDRIQRLRQYDRRIFDLNDDIVYRLTKLDTALQRCNIRLNNYVSTTGCKSYGDVVEAIAGGETSRTHS